MARHPEDTVIALVAALGVLLAFLVALLMWGL